MNEIVRKMVLPQFGGPISGVRPGATARSPRRRSRGSAKAVMSRPNTITGFTFAVAR